MTTHLMNTYNRQPVAFVRGEGAYLWDEAGKRYLDAVAGVAVNGLGHGHPKLEKAINKQTASLIHSSNLYRVLRQEELAGGGGAGAGGGGAGGGGAGGGAGE